MRTLLLGVNVDKFRLIMKNWVVRQCFSLYSVCVSKYLKSRLLPNLGNIILNVLVYEFYQNKNIVIT